MMSRFLTKASLLASSGMVISMLGSSAALAGGGHHRNSYYMPPPPPPPCRSAGCGYGVPAVAIPNINVTVAPKIATLTQTAISVNNSYPYAPATIVSTTGCGYNGCGGALNAVADIYTNQTSTALNIGTITQ